MKTTMTKIILLLLPFLAATLATTDDSVKLVEMATGEITYASYFELLPAESLQMAPPLAGMTAVLCVILALAAVFSKKEKLLQGTKWAAFAGACFAVLPVFARGETMMFPNIGVPLLLMGEFVLCSFGKKLQLDVKKAPEGPRLERH